jgi:sodium/bile acid cotransporter 7
MRALLVQSWFLWLLALVLGAALVFPSAVHLIADFWEPRPAVAMSLFLMAWTMPTQSLLVELRRPFASLWAVVLSYGLVPLASWLLGWLAPDPDTRTGLILISSVPCTFSSAVLWTRLAGGNEATALMTVVGTTLLSWALTPAWLSLLTGTEVALNVPAMMRDLVLTLIVPFLLGQGLRRVRACAHFAQRHKTALGVVAQGFILAMILRAGATVGDKLHENQVWQAPEIFLGGIVLALSLHLLAVAGGLFTSRWLGFDRAQQLAVAFASSQKTLPVSLVLYEQYFKQDFPYAVIPILSYHVGQLLLDTVIARRLHRHAPDTASGVA